jgi:hypothetical protein
LISTANQNGAVEPYLSDGFGITIQTGDGDGNGDGGMINITAGNAATVMSYGGDVTIAAGVNTGTVGQNGGIRLNSIVRMPVFADETARNQAGPQRFPNGWEDGSICFVTGVGLTIFIGEWRTISLVPLT